MDSDRRPSNLNRTFAVLTPTMGLALEDVGPQLYETLDANYDSFRNHSLVACHEFSADWSTWEMHPAGDELVVLLAGAATMVLLIDGEERLVELMDAQEFVVVPRGCWHTARVSEPTTMLFVTPGEGTLNAEEPPQVAYED